MRKKKKKEKDVKEVLERNKSSIRNFPRSSQWLAQSYISVQYIVLRKTALLPSMTKRWEGENRQG
jgi:hypothetical protein